MRILGPTLQTTSLLTTEYVSATWHYAHQCCCSVEGSNAFPNTLPRAGAMLTSGPSIARFIQVAIKRASCGPRHSSVGQQHDLTALLPPQSEACTG